MSVMLEQAIIDASALKEVAIKNAEAKVIEKYSVQIKEAINTILEQEDEENIGLEDPMAGMDDMGMGGEESEITSDIPLAATDGEKLCSCPEEEEEIEIDFNELEKQMGGQEEEMGHEELASEIPQVDMGKEEDEDIDLDEEQLGKIMEELEVDIEAVPTGWRGVPQSEREDMIDVALAQEQDSEIKKDNEKLRKELEDVKVENKQLKENKEKLSSDNKKYIKLLTELKDKMQSLVLNNAKLLYNNKILGSSSLNSQQKNKIVESIQKTKSMEEAKVIYESLQSTMSSSKEKKQESLSEAIVRPSTILISSKESKEKPTNEMSEKWQKLAGIKK